MIIRSPILPHSKEKLLELLENLLQQNFYSLEVATIANESKVIAKESNFNQVLETYAKKGTRQLLVFYFGEVKEEHNSMFIKTGNGRFLDIIQMLKKQKMHIFCFIDGYLEDKIQPVLHSRMHHSELRDSEYNLNILFSCLKENIYF